MNCIIPEINFHFRAVNIIDIIFSINMLFLSTHKTYHDDVSFIQKFFEQIFEIADSHFIKIVR